MPALSPVSQGYEPRDPRRCVRDPLGPSLIGDGCACENKGVPTAAASLHLRELLQAGFLLVPYDAEAELAILASRLGDITSHRVLRARESAAAPADTLTARHGLGAFPMHTDGAAQPIPPRWLVMRALAPTKTATFLYDATPAVLDPANHSLLRRPWAVTPGGARQAFYAPTLQPLSCGWRIRYNRACMHPTAGTAEPDCLTLLTGLEHHWRLDQVLIIDNWRMLHARGPVATEESRELERIAVK
jgi:alpha-ketoglutarate-dependent taurine dioxygenase